MWGNEKELIGICKKKKKKMDIISGNILMCWFLLVNFYFLRNFKIIVKYYNLYFNMNVIFCRSCNIFVFYFYDM